MKVVAVTILMRSLVIVCMTVAASAFAEERICTDTDDSRPVEVRWVPDVTVELRGKIYFLITTQAKRNLRSRSGIGGVLSAT